MVTICLHDKTFRPYLSANDIAQAIAAIADKLNQHYSNKRPLFIAILNGSFMFAADIFKAINFEAEICFIKLASYKGTKSSGQVINIVGLDTDIYNRHVVILEDIVDTGKTLHEFLPQLVHQQPASLKIATFLHKPAAVIYPITIHYLGFSIPNKFVVGYGLDYDGLGRNLPALYQLID
jgi:hypoxanthine phosphoribosyltransferase